MPSPGYTYSGTAFNWLTIPDVLERAGVSWRIYQDPNDNWTGAMHGCLAFESFRTATPEFAVYKNGLTHWSLADLANDVKNGTLPQVCWVLPHTTPVRASRRPFEPCTWRRFHSAGARCADFQSGGVERDRVLSDVRRERRPVRPHAAAGGPFL